MREKIEELIQHHKTANSECFELLQELNQLLDVSMSDENREALTNAKIKADEEYYYRRLFIQDLENLL